MSSGGKYNFSIRRYRLPVTHNLLSQIQAQRASDSQTRLEALTYAIQAVIATVAVMLLFRWIGNPNAMWAAVSAVLVLQPGFRSSLAASAVRVLANLLGAGIGVAVSLAIPWHAAAVAISLVLIVFACEWLRLDTGLRSAGASVLIVTMGTGSAIERGEQRALAVIAGCGVAIVLQIVLYAIVRRSSAAARLLADSE